MRYALLIYIEPWESTPEQDVEVMNAYNGFTRAAVAADVMRGGEALHEAKTATSVRVRNGQTLVTDGPFAETKEEFGGFYLIEAANLDEAIKWAAQIPGAARGTIEVRPVVDFPSPSNSGEEVDPASMPQTIAAG
ncbi:MAG: YciI family protein [Chloroflexota bacterium]